MSPSCVAFVVFQFHRICLIKSLKDAATTSLGICVTLPLSSSKPKAAVFTELCASSESPSMLRTKPVESEVLNPDTCIRSKVRSDSFASIPNRSGACLPMSSTQHDVSDSLSWVWIDSQSRLQSESESPLSSLLDVSSVHMDLQESALLQAYVSVNSGGGGMIVADKVVSLSADFSQSISCTHRPLIIGGSSPSFWICLGLVFLRCFLWRWYWGALVDSWSSVSLTRAASL